MPENEQNEKGGEVNVYAKYVGLAFQMIVVIGVFAFIGYKIDEAGKHTTKWAIASLSLLGVFASLYLVFRSVKN
ncbi:AtpZ/AtpI family protein [Mucilaginibacter sp.]|uniref:AtpZ/AtpI family protein n=1 Tax=Mucilaginibacter sp. TaxID=1882438 RepID=UPI0035BC6777